MKRLGINELKVNFNYVARRVNFFKNLNFLLNDHCFQHGLKMLIDMFWPQWDGVTSTHMRSVRNRSRGLLRNVELLVVRLSLAKLLYRANNPYTNDRGQCDRLYHIIQPAKRVATSWKWIRRELEIVKNIIENAGGHACSTVQDNGFYSHVHYVAVIMTISVMSKHT